ncbi:Mycothione reductase [Corynebacterium urogenitale]|uniref:Mycothione reductase n=1 Tax=Corynebacterium urogenitale TaxID=2487892 RepID=A0A5J6ZA69_9CORY|nr:mycothione reductase [Corynebacterium urogenitale]QFQ02545.1 Mycothione reductase [Corynebacterium urogenitale]
MAEHYDLIIVGTGSGNSLPSPEFDDHKIAIVEAGTFGGTCINVGCIPTKMFVYAADVAREIWDARRLSLDAELTGVDWKDIQRRVFRERIDPISNEGEEYRRGPETPNITLYSGTASFAGPRRLVIDDANRSVITGDAIVLATGGRPFVPPVIAESGVRYRTNEDIMRLEELPESLTILGGGIIAVEFAHVFSALGTKVTVINRSPKLLKKLDETVVERFNEVAATQWENKLGRTVEAVREDNGRVVVTLDDGQEVSSAELLVAMGRTNNSDRLDCAAGGVELEDDGRITVDRYGRTTAEGVWALGDAANEFELKHVANAEARVVQHNLLRPDDLREYNHELVPSGIFTHPQIATVGMTEAQARDAGHEVTVKVQEYRNVAYGWAMEDTNGFCKLIADARSGKLLGAHIMGPQASTLIQQLITVMAFDLDCREVAKNQYWPHPALSELVENALLGLQFTTSPPEGLKP